MPSKTTQISLLVLVAAAAVTAFLLPAPVADAAGCSACFGPARTAEGYGSGSTCSEAIQAAETQATINAFGGAPSCIPCQGSLTSYCSDIVVCHPAPGGVCEKTAFATYSYQCKSCGPF